MQTSYLNFILALDLVISRFGFEGRMWVLIPCHCTRVTFKTFEGPSGHLKNCLH